MKFKYFIDQNIPQLAWCAILSNNNVNVNIICGRAVENKDKFFVSGVWDGNFDDGDFENCSFSCCSGGKLIDDGVMFVTPQTLLESLFSIKKDERIYISNSLPFLLKTAHCELDENYLKYEEELCSGLFGYEKQVKSSILKNGVVLRYFRGVNVFIKTNIDDNVFECIENRRLSNLNYSGYEDYRRKVVSILRKIVKNANDVGRKLKFANLTTTISKGYDAAASSALAHEVGCDRVITFNRPEVYANDDGTSIAEQLGYKDIIQKDASEHLQDELLLDALQFAHGEVNSSLFAALFPLLNNGLFFMGNRGDSIWEWENPNVNDNQDFSYGNSLMQSSLPFIETCLEHNIVIVNVPMIGCDEWSNIYRISRSCEMSHWHIRDIYDRPIARRVLEDKGVCRESFGNIKYGAGMSYHHDTMARLGKRMSPKSYKSLIEFKKSLKRNRIKFH